MRTLAQLLPSAEMGTAQQELPVATVNTMHTLQLTTEELRLLAHAMHVYRDPGHDDEYTYPSKEAADLDRLLADFR